MTHQAILDLMHNSYSRGDAATGDLCRAALVGTGLVPDPGEAHLPCYPDEARRRLALRCAECGAPGSRRVGDVPLCEAH